MTNIAITINAPDLSQALNALAEALRFNKTNDQAPFNAPVAAVAHPIPVVAPVPVSPAMPNIAPTLPVNTAPSVSNASGPAITPVPTTAPAYSRDQLALAAAPLIDAGKQTDLINLLANFGVRAMTELKEEQLGAFATALRGLGAKI